MATPSQEGDIVLGTASYGVLLRNDRHLPIASTETGDYWAWVDNFNPLPPVEMSTNDVPVVYDYGTRPGGDVPLARRYQFEFWAEWETDAGLVALLTNLTTVSVPLASGTTELSFMFGGVVWTLTGRYEPFAMGRSEYAEHAKVATFLVRFRATDPVLRGGGAEYII